MLPVVIAQVPHQKLRVERLVQYCKDLDGTKVRVVPVDDSLFVPQYNTNHFANRQSFSFHTAAKAMRGSPFIWLEADSIPLKPGWVDALSKEYAKLKSPFLLPPTPESPYDVAAGIGVYPAESHWLIPQQFQNFAWDLWQTRHLAPAIKTTRLLQHSYGAYDNAGNAQEHRFPRDKDIIRPDAVLFHRDRYQDLLPLNGMARFCHSGDLGDILACLPAIRQIGGGALICTTTPSGQRETLKGPRFDAIQPLLESVPFLVHTEYQDDPSLISHSFLDFRKIAQKNRNLEEWQAASLGLNTVDQTPWLSVEPNPQYAGAVVISRSPRYHNPNFPWRQILQKFVKKLVFVGTPQEHAAFRNKFGVSLELAKTPNLLEAARIIAGARLFVGNQSCPFWIASGLGVPLVQETWWAEPNSIVLRENAAYTHNAGAISGLLKHLPQL
jgi:hypothetical protein